MQRNFVSLLIFLHYSININPKLPQEILRNTNEINNLTSLIGLKRLSELSDVQTLPPPYFVLAMFT
jgi:hypothetical protein